MKERKKKEKRDEKSGKQKKKREKFERVFGEFSCKIENFFFGTGSAAPAIMTIGREGGGGGGGARVRERE